MIQKKDLWWSNFEMFDLSAIKSEIWVCEGYDYLKDYFFACDLQDELENGFICNCPFYTEIYVKINRLLLSKLIIIENDDVLFLINYLHYFLFFLEKLHILIQLWPNCCCHLLYIDFFYFLFEWKREKS